MIRIPFLHRARLESTVVAERIIPKFSERVFRALGLDPGQAVRRSFLPAREIRDFGVALQERATQSWLSDCGFPEHGWADRGGLESLRRSVFSEGVVLATLRSPHLDWSRPLATLDLLALLRADARRVVQSVNSASLAGWTLSIIPSGRTDLRDAYCDEMERLDPLWHERDASFLAPTPSVIYFFHNLAHEARAGQRLRLDRREIADSARRALDPAPYPGRRL